MVHWANFVLTEAFEANPIVKIVSTTSNEEEVTLVFYDLLSISSAFPVAQLESFPSSSPVASDKVGKTDRFQSEPTTRGFKNLFK